MILTIDVGNTNIVFAFYKDSKVHSCFRHSTKYNKTEDEYAVFLLKLMEKSEINSNDIAGVIIASVVPQINNDLIKMCKKFFLKEPLVLGDDNVQFNLKINIDNPKSLGADRIATSVGAIERYKSNMIIVDFGTATTFDIIGKDRDFIGGIIAPGIRTSIESLHKNTALLPLYEVEKPEKIIATSLNDALHTGIFYGSIGMIEKIVSKIKKELDNEIKVIITGGLSGLFKQHLNCVDIHDEDLTTFGLYKIYTFNNASSHAI